MQSKRLILRMSSLGDVILASSALEVDSPSHAESSFDWVVAQGFHELLVGHPKINKLHIFNRSQGLRSWVSFCRSLWDARYEQVFDLHKSIRSRLMHLLFWFWAVQEGKLGPVWKTVDKQRGRLYLYYFFKSLWPNRFRPIPWVIRFSQRVGGVGTERPNLRHLLRSQAPPELPRLLELAKSFPEKKGYLCIMPSSRWLSKTWPVASYVEALARLPYFPVVLGTKSDGVSIELVSRLKESGLPHFSGVGEWNLSQTAWVLSQSSGYFGGDTGLAHLAEAVGVSAKILFGPTAPEMGFGPWRAESRSLELDLWCRPCGKDGRNCYRVFDRYACLKRLSVDSVIKDV